MILSDLNRIKAIGNLLQYYHSDLHYITRFQMFKKGELSANDYLLESSGSFPRFIKEYRVMRNIEQGKLKDVLSLTEKWVHANQADDVDGFADCLKGGGCTHGKQMTSLASKVLFLNNPWQIIPLDQWNKKALGVKTNSYCDFIGSLRSKEIDCSLAHEDEYLVEIERYYLSLIENIGVIRKNRFLDKLLWVAGQGDI